MEEKEVNEQGLVENVNQEEEVAETADDLVQEVAEDIKEEVQPKNRKNGKRKRRIETQDEPLNQSEWQERVVQIRRVTKVVKGGKKLSFRAIVVVGNQKGQVGVGCSKASEVIIAIQKAVSDAKKNLISVPIFKKTIPHPITGRSGAGRVMLRPAAEGTGVISGGAVRAVLELAGIENILSKSLGSKSPLNAANATINALNSLTMFSDVARKRGMTVREILS